MHMKIKGLISSFLAYFANVAEYVSIDWVLLHFVVLRMDPRAL